MSRKVNDKDVKLLWGLAAARCSYPSCRVTLVIAATQQDPAATLGEMAHIHAHSKGGPRYNASLAANVVDSYNNLILLCGIHHNTIDGQPNSYTAADVQKWKDQHEEWVQKSLRASITSVTFLELAMVTSHIVGQPTLATSNLSVTAPEEKMQKNDLKKSAFKITLGLAKSPDVAHYISHQSKIDADFPERLKQGFVSEYQRLKAMGLVGDALFEAIHYFACDGNHAFDKQAAGLAVVCYLFEACELFER